MAPHTRKRTTSQTEKERASATIGKKAARKTSAYRGVSKYKNGPFFKAQFKVRLRSYYLGFFKTPEEAAYAYDIAMRLLETNAPCKGNFPERSIAELMAHLSSEHIRHIDSQVAIARAVIIAEQPNVGRPPASDYWGVRLRAQDSAKQTPPIWEARLHFNNSDTCIAIFSSAKEAAYARDLAVHYLGKSTSKPIRLNFPDEDIASLQNKFPNSVWQSIQEKVLARKTLPATKRVRISESNSSTSSTTTAAQLKFSQSTTMLPLSASRGSDSRSSGSFHDEILADAFAKDPELLPWLLSLEENITTTARQSDADKATPRPS